MRWLESLLQSPSVAGTIIVLGAVCAVGLALGAMKIKGVGLGVAGVLFAGLAAANLELRPDAAALSFVRDFGLILFVFGIGLQIGPGFLASLRRGGLKLNLLAAGVVVTGAAIVLVLAKFAHVPGAAAVGLLAGATTNTPSLAAAQAVLADRPAEGPAGSLVSLATAGYALAYPGGVVGTILVMAFARAFLKAAAAPASTGASPPARPKVAQINLLVTNASLDGVPLGRLPIINEAPRDQDGADEGSGTVVVTRHLAGDTLSVPTAASVLHTGDMLLAVGPAERLDQLRMVVGCLSPIDLREYPSEIVSKRLVVTRREVLGRTLADLDILGRYGVTISRVGRAGVEITPWPALSFNYADAVLAVGPADNVKQVAALLGNLPKALDHPQLIPVFLGIALGAALGSVPLALPGLPGVVKLGLAGGPLLVAIVLSRVGRVGPMVCYLPLSANFALREVGIALFLACVGLTSGTAFVQAISSWRGLAWLGMGAAVTLVPLLLCAVVGRAWLKLDFGSLCGVLAGSMTDPPALAYANSLAGSDGPAMAYTTVYPLTMILRVFCAQLLVGLLLP